MRATWFWCDTHGDFVIRPLCPQCECDATKDTVTISREVFDAMGLELMRYRKMALGEARPLLIKEQQDGSESL